MWNLTLLAALSLAPAQDLITLQHVPFAEMLRHPKDAGLARLVQLAPAALERFAAEQGEGAPPGLIELAIGLVTSGKALVIGAASGSEVPFYASLVFAAPDAAAAAQRMKHLTDLLEMSGATLGGPQANGLRVVDAPTPVPIALGTVGTGLALTVGTNDIARPKPVVAGLPQGVTPWVQLHQAAETVEALLAMQGGDPAMSALATALNPSDLDVAIGSDGKRMWSASTMRGGAAPLRRAGGIPAGGLPTAALARIPADAVFAGAMRLEWAGLWNMFQTQVSAMMEASGMPAPNLQEELAAELGFDLVTEVLPHFGPTTGVYLSDTTGGGTLTSTVLFTEVRDAAAVASLTARLEAFIQEESDGEAELRTLRAGELTLTSLVFPGLPVPVTPTWVVDDGYLYIGLSSQAAAAAVEAARAGGGLAQNPRFRAGMDALGHDPSVVSVSFLDAPALLRDGYTYANLAMDAVGNLARATGQGEDVGLLMPSLGVLARGAEASVGVTRAVGDDLVSAACGDLSWMVNLTAIAGLLDRSGLIMALPMMVFGAQSPGMAATAFGAPEEMEWTSPLLEGGSLVTLNDWMVTGVEESTGETLAQLEVHIDKTAGALSIYVVDAGVTSYVRTAQASLVVEIQPEEGEPYEMTLNHVANDATGETIGDSAHYRATDARLQGLPYVNGTVRAITVNGMTFENVYVWCFAP